MPPRCLLFSSDEEASRLLIQALEELELEIEPYPEIFGALETLARHKLDVVLADLDAGPEANFLLTSVRELKLNKDAVAVAVVSAATRNAARTVGADLVLTKPVISDQVKYALLSCDRFLSCLRAQLARRDSATTRPAAPPPVLSHPPKAPFQPLGVPEPATPSVEAYPSPRPAVVKSAPNLNFRTGSVTPNLSRLGNPVVGKPHWGGSGYRRLGTRDSRGRFLLAIMVGVVFLALGYAATPASRNQKVLASLTNLYQRGLEKTHAKMSDFSRNWRQTEDGKAPGSAIVTQAASFQFPAPLEPSTARLRAIPAHHSSVAAPAASVAAGQPAVEKRLDQGASVAAVGVRIPESIRRPLPEVETVHIATSKLTLLGELEPVNLSEEASEELLLEKVQPSYPQQALKAGMQGAVVLEAWIGTDGNVRDLKLVRGPLLLGRAAYQAVKQWRYKPYLRSGKAMEALTYVTVTFTLPQQSLVSPSSH